MRLADRDWLLYCRRCREWTGLHRFLHQRGHFQGELSLAMNAYLNSDLILGRFLLHHADHEVVPVPDQTDEYRRVRIHEDRFLEGQIDSMVEERVRRDQDLETERRRAAQEGMTALLALRTIIAGRIRELESTTPDEPSEAGIHLGKTLGLEWCKEQIDRLLEFHKPV